MKLKQKLLTVIAIVLGAIISGTNVYATEFTGRILKHNELSLKVSGTFTQGTEITEIIELTTDEQAILDTLTQGEKKVIYKEDVESFENIFCIDSSINLPGKNSGLSPEYVINGAEEKYEDDAIAYILSYPRISGDLGKELRNQIIQVALWETGLNSSVDPEYDATVGEALANEAEAFEEYRDNLASRLTVKLQWSKQCDIGEKFDKYMNGTN